MFDALIIGSGAGGGAAALVLAKRGWKVALLEKSSLRSATPSHQSTERMFGKREGYQKEELHTSDTKVLPRIGEVLGGPTSLFGAVMLRPSREDFMPGLHFGRYLSKGDWNWQLQYEDLEHYYDRAEDLYNVCGVAEDIRPHLEQRTKPYLSEPAAFTPSNQDLSAAWKAKGVSHFGLPQAIDQRICKRCPKCPGYFCPTGARSSSANRCIAPAMETGNITLMSGVTAREIGLRNSRSHSRTASGIYVSFGNSQKIEFIEARVIVCAAGAIGTPQLFHRSRLTDLLPAVGRYLTYHCGIFAIHSGLKTNESSTMNTKQIGSSEFYFGTKSKRHKLGILQHIPMPHTLKHELKLPLPLPEQLYTKFRTRSQGFGMIIEDVPQRTNRLHFGNGNRPTQLIHSFHPYDLFRISLAKEILKSVFSSSRPSATFQFDNVFQQSLISHAVGTMRSGSSAVDSVVDGKGKVHHFDNLYVCDGSVLPGSLGVGPALTIVANAMRIAEHI